MTGSRIIGILSIVWMMGLAASCSPDPPQAQILATVGEKQISLEDFKRAYLPVLLYSDKRESPQTREEILNYLIDQAILSQTARALELDTIPTLETLQRTALKTAFTRILYQKQVKDQLPTITDEALRQAYRQSHTQRLVRHLFSKDSSEAWHMFSELQRGASWDSLAIRHFAEPSLAASGGVLGWIKFGDMDPDFEQAAYALPLRTISPPVKTKFGWHIIRADEESRELMLTEYDYQLERSSLERTLRLRHEQRRSDAVIHELMSQAGLSFNEQTATAVWDLMRQQMRRLMDNAQLTEIVPEDLHNFGDLLTPLLDEDMLSFSGQTWTVEDFLTHLPEMNRQLMLSDIKQATAFLVRDEVIYQTGMAAGYDKLASVQAEVQDREDQFLANLYLRFRATDHQLSETAVKSFYDEHAATRYLDADSLFIQEILVLDPSELDRIQADLEQGIDLSTLQKQYRLAIAGLGWHNGTDAGYGAYYHSLAKVPVLTKLGPFQSAQGPVFVQATMRRRHPRTLEQIYPQVEQDAYDYWLDRLKLEEVERLRANYPISIDKALLHNFHI